MFGLDSLITGGLSLLGNLFAQDKTDERQEKAQQFNAEQAQINRDFQDRMSSTAYQRGMLDMKTAGLNPILAYQKGPASSPTGAMASTTFTPANDVITPAVNTAMAAKRVTAEVENMIQTNSNLKAQNELLHAQRLQVNADTVRSIRQTENIAAETAIKNEALQVAMREAVKGKIDEEFYQSAIGKIFRQVGTGFSEINPLATRAQSTFSQRWSGGN